MYFYQTGDRFDGKRSKLFKLQLIGQWEANLKQGEGTYYYVDGTIYHGIGGFSIKA